MAKAKQVTETVHISRSVNRVQLNLNDGEVDFLLAVLAKIGGSTVNSPRKYQERIQNALEKTTGLYYEDTDAYALLNGGMHFEDYADPSAGQRKDN